MENSPIDFVGQELDGLAPNLQKMRKGKLAMVPDNYFENLTGELTRQVALTLTLETAAHTNQVAEADNPEVRLSPAGTTPDFADIIKPAFMAELDKNKQSDAASPKKERSWLLSFTFIRSPRWMAAAAAILVLIIAFIIYFQVPAEKIPEAYTSQLTDEETYVFVEENLDDLTLEELIDHGFIEQDDVSLIPATSLPESNDTL